MIAAEAVQEVRQRTDLVGAAHVSDDLILRCLNRSFARTHERLVKAFEDYAVRSAVLTVAPGASGFSLPSDFFAMLRLDRSESGVADRGDWVRMPRIHLRDETAHHGLLAGYVMAGTDVRIVPRAIAAGAYQLLYYPAWTPLSATQTVAIGPVGQQWEEHGILKACLDIGGPEGVDMSTIAAEYAKMDMDLDAAIAIRNADQAEPPPVGGHAWYDR